MTRSVPSPALVLGVGVATSVALATTSACTTERDAVEYGREVFSSTDALVRTDLNAFSCADCHAVTAEPPDDLIRPGATLYGAVGRERYWGGQVLTLSEAVDACVVNFMHGQPLDHAGEAPRALYEYLVSISPPGAPTATLPMTVVENILPLFPGDAARGEPLYRRACAYCHGAKDTGAGQILRKPILLPNIADEYATIFPGTPPGLVFTEITRHGRFFNVGGSMPFFSLETLTDDELADILAYLGVASD